MYTYILIALVFDIVSNSVLYQLLLRRERVQKRIERRLNDWTFHRRFEQ